MNTHDRNLVFMMFMAAALVSLNFFAVTSGLADGYYDQLTELLRPLLLNRDQALVTSHQANLDCSYSCKYAW